VYLLWKRKPIGGNVGPNRLRGMIYGRRTPPAGHSVKAVARAMRGLRAVSPTAHTVNNKCLRGWYV